MPDSAPRSHRCHLAFSVASLLTTARASTLYLLKGLSPEVEALTVELVIVGESFFRRAFLEFLQCPGRTPGVLCVMAVGGGLSAGGHSSLGFSTLGIGGAFGTEAGLGGSKDAGFLDGQVMQCGTGRATSWCLSLADAAAALGIWWSPPELGRPMLMTAPGPGG